MRILITNAYLDVYGGTQVVVRDLAGELRRQGHDPIVYARHLGPVADELRDSGIAVTNQLGCLTAAPDIIHGQHYPAIEALLRFPSTPAIYVCHGSVRGYSEALAYFPRVLRYVAVDDLCKKRVENVPGIPGERITVFWNAVDLERYQRRGPLPARPRRALVFSNAASNSTHLRVVRKACRQAGLQLDVIGLLSDNAVPNPEAILPRYDIVFAKARCALEAMAVGNAVVLCDFKGLGPMVSSENFDRLRPKNFGYSLLVNPLRPELIRAEIERYDPDNAAAVCERIRKEAGLVEATRRWVELYTAVIEEFRRSGGNYDEEFRAFASYWTEWNYGRRVEWEMEQLRRLRSVPLVGGALTYFARRVLRKWFSVYGIP